MTTAPHSLHHFIVALFVVPRYLVLQHAIIKRLNKNHGKCNLSFLFFLSANIILNARICALATVLRYRVVISSLRHNGERNEGENKFKSCHIKVVKQQN